MKKYGVSTKNGKPLYSIKFDNEEDALKWLNTEEYDFREREIFNSVDELYEAYKEEFDDGINCVDDLEDSMRSYTEEQKLSQEFLDDLENSYKFEYQLLSRMTQDCEYFLGYGNGCEKYLWANNVEEQISKMRELWQGFPDNAKPEWCTMEDINNYESRMTELKNNKTNDIGLDEPEI